MSHKIDLSDLEREADTRSPSSWSTASRRRSRPGCSAGGEAAHHAGARGGRRRQPPHGRARVQAAGGARLRDGDRGPRHVRRARSAAGSCHELGTTGRSTRCPTARHLSGDQVLDDAFRLAERAGHASRSRPAGRRRRSTPRSAAGSRPTCFRDEGGAALTTSPPRASTRCASRSRTAWRGFATDPEEIIVTSGARQAIDLVARALLEPGDVAVIESPTFIGMLSSLRDRCARVIGVPWTRTGWTWTRSSGMLARHEVKLARCRPSARTRPAGTSRRSARGAWPSWPGAELLRARGRGVRGHALRRRAPAAAARARARARDLLDSLSKTVGGGLRVGWIAARGPVFERMAMLKLRHRLPHQHAVAAHGARFLAGRPRAPHRGSAALLPRAPRR